MEIRINRKSEIPLRRQLVDQIIFSIATKQLEPGESLPSVRELARRLKIHRNTISQAYRDLESRGWLVAKRGCRVIVQARGKQTHTAASRDLDDLLNATIQVAREQGYTLTRLTECVERRSELAPPDRILVVENEPGLRMLLQEEIRPAFHKPVDGCSLADLVANPRLAIGALPVVPHFAIAEVSPFLSKGIPAIPLAFSTADEQLKVVRMLEHPSVIGVISVSRTFLKTALTILSPVAGERHSLHGYDFPLESSGALKAADVVFADSIASQHVKHKKLFPYHLIRRNSLDYLVDAMKSYDST